MPASPCFKIPAICSSLNLVRFIRLPFPRLLPPGYSHFTWIRSAGQRQADSVVIVTPAFDSFSCARQAEKPVGIETFVAKSAIERFDVAILHGPARLDVAQQH